MEKTYAQNVANSKNPKIKYESFDFHKECKGMRFDRLNILTERLSDDRRTYGSVLLMISGLRVSLIHLNLI